jgi:hypothetical protein
MKKNTQNNNKNYRIKNVLEIKKNKDKESKNQIHQGINLQPSS